MEKSWRTPLVVLVCGSLIMLISFGVRAGFGLFMQPISLEHGWGREVLSLSLALQQLAWGALGAVAGGFADRYGPGRVIAVGALLYIAGLVGMAYAPTPLAMHFFTGGLIPASQFLIGHLGWHGALLGLAVIAILILPLSTALASERPVVSGAAPQSLGEALHEALAEKGFHLLFWGYFVCGFHIAMLTMHLPSFVTDSGLKPEHGMTALALIGLFNVIGTFSAGWLGGRVNKKYLLSGIYSIRVLFIALLVFFPLSPLTLY